MTQTFYRVMIMYGANRTVIEDELINREYIDKFLRERATKLKAAGRKLNMRARVCPLWQSQITQDPIQATHSFRAMVNGKDTIVYATTSKRIEAEAIEKSL